MVEIVCVNKGSIKKRYAHGITLQEIAEDLDIKLQYPVLGAKVNNQVKSLAYQVYTSRVIEFFDTSTISGYTMYEHSLSFLLYKAAKELYPQEEITIKHSILGGKFCEFENSDFVVSDDIVAKLENKMNELVKADLVFTRRKMLTEEAVALYDANGMWDKHKLLKYRKIFYTSVYEIGGTINYFFGCLVPSTRYLNCFGLIKYENGLLLRMPSRKAPSKLPPTIKAPKLFNIIKEHKEWSRIMEVPYVGDLNDIIQSNHATDLLLMSEALQEKKLISIADDIKKHEDVKMILISGPSSSGKTTTCRRLSVQLGVMGYKPIQISADNYFVERELTPKDEHGNYDFEHINALDLPLFNQQLSDLIAGKEVETPVFDFQQGKKVWKGDTMKLGKKSLIVIEGIHCLNPLLTQEIDPSLTYKLFVSALTSLAMDKHNPIHSNDNRLIRRIVRDYNYRGYSAQESIRRWESVRNGEERWIFPFQENANSMFNSAMLCELSLFKKYALPLLDQVPENANERTEAYRLMKLLSYFLEVSDGAVPHYSILREFFGGSVFSY